MVTWVGLDSTCRDRPRRDRIISIGTKISIRITIREDESVIIA
jgi:hypothetical protein